MIRSNSEQAFQNFRDEIENSTHLLNIEDMSHNSTDVNYEILHEAIENAQNKHLPILVKYDKHNLRKTKCFISRIFCV